ncbi:hypothetical protein CI684_10090 [Shigella sonnei]|nr:hypothetical protein CI685_13100 [Shigella sonnei]OYJ20244.1 hypothetical protein CI684_10090 [Shigella sonnei]PDV49646.1 hypothetical protein BER13_15285 [Escherichia coli]POO45816.1 hypothetical protein CTZ33_13560 [Escherichia coli]
MAQSPPPWQPGLPAVNRRWRGSLILFLSAIGYGREVTSCKTRPQPTSMWAAPAYRKRFGDLQPDPHPRCDVRLPQTTLHC